MEIKGKKQKVFNEFVEFLDKCSDEETIHCYFSKKETKKMIQHTQRKFLRGLCSEIANFMGEEPERVKQIFLIGCFKSKEMKMGDFKTDIPIRPTTSELTKKETIFYINTMWKFICDRNIPCKYTPREIQNLLLTYN